MVNCFGRDVRKLELRPDPRSPRADSPVIYAMIVPIVLLDALASLYQLAFCPVYGVQRSGGPITGFCCILCQRNVQLTTRLGKQL